MDAYVRLFYSIHSISHMHFDAKERRGFKYDRLLPLGLQQRRFACLLLASAMMSDTVLDFLTEALLLNTGCCTIPWESETMHSVITVYACALAPEEIKATDLEDE